MGWKVKQPLLDGMKKTYKWINAQVKIKHENSQFKDSIDLMINAE